jgi:hypothetical protein
MIRGPAYQFLHILWEEEEDDDDLCDFYIERKLNLNMNCCV